MTKFSVTKSGIPLKKSLYTWDEKTKTFSSKEDHLVLDFKGIDDVTFRTGSGCMFYTGSYCVFNTGGYCTFTTYHSCTFITGSDCIFMTGGDCIFNTGPGCTFETDADCLFKTGTYCKLNTGENCFVARRDKRGITEIPAVILMVRNINQPKGKALK